jgi:hypothetical protein
MRPRNPSQELRAAELLADFMALGGPAPDVLDTEMWSLASVIRDTLPPDPPTTEFVTGLRRRLEQRPLGARRGERKRIRSLYLAGIALLTAAIAVIAFLAIQQIGGRGGVVSAEDVLAKARATVASPESAGIRSMVLTQTSTVFFLADERRGQPSMQIETRLWYDTPGRQRIETAFVEMALDGTVGGSGHRLDTWTGAEHWRVTPEGNVWVLSQAADSSPYSYGVAMAGLPADLDTISNGSCRSPRLLSEDRVAGRDAYVVELTRPRCGYAFPGRDGKGLVWIDKQTGLILKWQQFAVDGTLFFVQEVTSIEYNGQIESDQFSYAPAPGTQVTDYRSQPPQVFTRFEEPTISLGEARAGATFTVLEPTWLPAGFGLESVQHIWGSEEARRLKSHADWVLLRYVDAQGNWLLVSQGYTGFVVGWGMGLPQPPLTGLVELKGGMARWFDGNPINRWEPGTMLALGWMQSETPAPPDGFGGSPLSAVLSNVLTLEQLVRVAESLR